MVQLVKRYDCKLDLSSDPQAPSQSLVHFVSAILVLMGQRQADPWC